MNYRAVAWLLGCVLLLLAGVLILPAVVALFYREHDSMRACLASAGVAAALGGILTLRNRGATVARHGRVDYFRREGLAAVGLCWFAAGAVGALPFLFSGQIPSVVDAFFESASGFTTTGATILDGAALDALPRSISFWRSFTHWLGGIGIVLVFVLLFPTGGRSLFRSEVPGVSREAVQQRVRDSAWSLVRIYVGLTAMEVVALMALGMTPFDAVLHSFGTLATGGFSSHSASVAFFASWQIEFVIVFFMFLAGINFGYYDTMLRNGWRDGWRAARQSEELRIYTAMIVGSALVLTGVLWLWGGSNGDTTSDLPDYSQLSLALRDASFNVVSIQTSTGFGTADFDRWPQFCRMLLMLLAFTGACAGSTGGGLKVMRFILLAKASVRGFKRFARPRAIHPVRADGQPIEDRFVAGITGYFGMWAIVFSLGALAMTSLGVDLITATTSVLATLNNIGPGLAAVGPTMNYGDLPELGKIMLSVFMIVGRLEFYAVVVLFLPTFWRH